MIVAESKGFEANSAHSTHRNLFCSGKKNSSDKAVDKSDGAIATNQIIIHDLEKLNTEERDYDVLKSDLFHANRRACVSLAVAIIGRRWCLSTSTSS